MQHIFFKKHGLIQLKLIPGRFQSRETFSYQIFNEDGMTVCKTNVLGTLWGSKYIILPVSKYYFTVLLCHKPMYCETKI